MILHFVFAILQSPFASLFFALFVWLVAKIGKHYKGWIKARGFYPLIVNEDIFCEKFCYNKPQKMLINPKQTKRSKNGANK
ncbi:hypothetical protein HMPREF2086_00230 [Helicobacter macacae MIT 99-5501]|uniref:Uncharacterized protein n=1 Tax=Helicobacter macacae MIT 99-5501 TaxID=1357400 RepID=V8CDT6_9HELI|nr:hypothetical protein HMPREF2086_00230 [Helicobacter macacae MIT 99-5501]